jgi:hypothetical protein
MTSNTSEPEGDVDEDMTAAARVARARVAAEQFGRQFGFSEPQLEALQGPPIQPPLVIERDGRRVEVYRWLGHGRGQSSIQVEIDLGNDAVTVYGSLGDRGLGPWYPPS